MKPARTNKTYPFMACLILTFVYLSPALAVTDAELEALEKQIEQQEEEAKKKAAEKRKLEMEKKRQTAKQQDEKRRQEAERKQQEELAKQLKEEENNKKLQENLEYQERLRAEKEIRKNYDKHIDLADTYMAQDEFEDAISEYQKALDLYPDDFKAKEAIEKAKQYLNACEDIVGNWLVQPNAIRWSVHNDKTVYGTWLIFSANGFWECVDLRKREVVISWPDCAVCFTEYFYISEDNNTLKPSRGTGSLGRRVIESEPERKAKQPDIKL